MVFRPGEGVLGWVAENGWVAYIRDTTTDQRFKSGADQGFDWSNFAPRLGATYALGEERKTLIRGSYSWFAEQLSSGNVNHINFRLHW